MKIAIVGYGAQGASSYTYWQNLGHSVTVHDQNATLKLPAEISAVLGEGYLDGLENYDLVVRSPSVHPKLLDVVPPEKITSNTNEFFRVCPTKNIIGVTGTKGKGTTSTLIAKILETAGKRAHLGGNIGTPPLDLLKNRIRADDWVVLELANFQLIDMKYSPPVAVVLMVVPEHLDWHANFTEYKQAKARITAFQTEKDIVVYNAINKASREIVSGSKARKIGYMGEAGARVEEDRLVIDEQTICRTDEVKLLGKHNLENVCAAVTCVWQITPHSAAMRSVITSFSGLEHRLELVRELDGVRYYDDSFGTTPETAIVAYRAFDEPKIGIVGGSDKGIPFDDLAETLASENLRALIAIGDTGPEIARLVRAKNPRLEIIEGLSSLTEIVNKARELARAGDVVLLSTGCASFGLFKDYKDRGEQFKQAVLALA